MEEEREINDTITRLAQALYRHREYCDNDDEARDLFN
jgi:hypothetical protein